MLLSEVFGEMTSLVNIADFLLGVGGRQADPENKKDVLQESHANGDRMVRLHLRGGAEHEDIGVSRGFLSAVISKRWENVSHMITTLYSPAAISTRSIMP